MFCVVFSDLEYSQCWAQAMAECCEVGRRGSFYMKSIKKEEMLMLERTSSVILWVRIPEMENGGLVEKQVLVYLSG